MCINSGVSWSQIPTEITCDSVCIPVFQYSKLRLILYISICIDIIVKDLWKNK